MLALADIDAVWPLVLRGARRAGMNDRTTHLMRERCLDGSAACLACRDGAVVVTARECDGRMRAMVLLAVSAGAPGAFRRQEQEMLQVARELGAVELAFTTKRRGWTRLLGPQWQWDGEMFFRSVP